MSELEGPAPITPFHSNTEYLEEYGFILRGRLSKLLGRRTPSTRPGETAEQLEGTVTSCLTPQGTPVEPGDWEKRNRAFPARVQATLRRGKPGLPLEELARSNGLTAIEKDILAAMFLLSDDAGFRQLFEDAAGTPSPCVQSFCTVFCSSLAEIAEARASFLSPSRLIDSRLICWRGDSRLFETEADFMTEPLEMPLEIQNLICNPGLGLDDAAGNPRLVIPSLKPEDLVLGEQKAAALRAIAECCMEGPPECEPGGGSGGFSKSPLLVVFRGRTGTGRRSAAEAAASMAGKNLLRIDASEIARSHGEPIATLGALASLACSSSAIPFITNADWLFADTPNGRFDQEALLDILDSRCGGAVVFSVSDSARLDGVMAHSADIVVEFHPLTARERAALIDRMIPGSVERAPTLDLNAAAAMTKSPVRCVRKAVIRALRKAASRPPGRRALLTSDFVPPGGPSSEPWELGSTASATVPEIRLDDLVLPTSLHEKLYEIVAFIRRRSEVMGTWGMGRLEEPGSGIAALFTGPEGTGKAAAARAIAGELGMPFRVESMLDLRNTRDGEMDEGIARMLRASAEGGEVLLVEDARLLAVPPASCRPFPGFGDRSNILKTAGGIRSFAGIVILSETLLFEPDREIARLLGWRIEFPEPDSTAREAIWRKCFPPEAPVADDVDFHALAGRFEMAGGRIRSAARRAALRAADRGERITMEHLLWASETELDQ